MKSIIRLPGFRKVGLRKGCKTCQIDFTDECKGGVGGWLVGLVGVGLVVGV